MDQKTVKIPAHYTEGRKFEPKDVIRDWGLDFNLGSTVKYIARAGRKDDILQDLNKAKEFLQFEIEAIEAEIAKQPAPTPSHPNCRCSFEEAVKHSEEMEKEKHKDHVNKIIKDIVAGMDGVDLMAVAEVSPNEGMIAVTCRGDLDADEVQAYIRDELVARLRLYN